MFFFLSVGFVVEVLKREDSLTDKTETGVVQFLLLLKPGNQIDEFSVESCFGGLIFKYQMSTDTPLLFNYFSYLYSNVKQTVVVITLRAKTKKINV